MSHQGDTQQIPKCTTEKKLYLIRYYSGVVDPKLIRKASYMEGRIFLYNYYTSGVYVYFLYLLVVYTHVHGDSAMSVTIPEVWKMTL